MGWCSATEIMDAAIKAAETAVHAVIQEIQRDNGKGRSTAEWDIQAVVDEALSPFVKTIAEHLNDGDWDCHRESAYYDRFAQEMHGDTDEEYMDRLAEELAEEVKYEGVTTERYRQLVARIQRHAEKMRTEKNANGG